MDFHFHSLCHVNIHIFLPLGVAFGSKPLNYEVQRKKANKSMLRVSAIKTLPDGANDLVNEGAEGEKNNPRELTGCLTPECSPKSLVSASAVHAESSSHGGYTLIMCASLCTY